MELAPIALPIGEVAPYPELPVDWETVARLRRVLELQSLQSIVIMTCFLLDARTMVQSSPGTGCAPPSLGVAREAHLALGCFVVALLVGRAVMAMAAYNLASRAQIRHPLAFALGTSVPIVSSFVRLTLDNRVVRLMRSAGRPAKFWPDGFLTPEPSGK